MWPANALTERLKLKWPSATAWISPKSAPP